MVYRNFNIFYICLSVLPLLAQMYDLTPMIITVPMCGISYHVIHRHIVYSSRLTFIVGFWSGWDVGTRYHVHGYTSANTRNTGAWLIYTAVIPRCASNFFT